MEFKILTSEELEKLTNKERREYLKKKKEYDNQKLIEDTLESAKEEEKQEKEIKESTEEEQYINKEETHTEKKENIAISDKKKNEKTNNKERTEKHQTESVSKIGRPKGRPSSKISVNVPSEFIDYIEIASGIKYRGNTSSYISALIERDIEENKSIYNQIKKLKSN